MSLPALRRGGKFRVDAAHQVESLGRKTRTGWYDMRKIGFLHEEGHQILHLLRAPVGPADQLRLEKQESQSGMRIGRINDGW